MTLSLDSLRCGLSYRKTTTRDLLAFLSWMCMVLLRFVPLSLMLTPLENSLKHPSQLKLLPEVVAVKLVKKSSCTAVLAVDGAQKLKEISTRKTSSTLS